MSREEFLKGLSLYKKGIDYMEKLENEFDIDLFESSLANSNDTLFDLWLSSILKNDEAADLIYWWLFEDVEKKIYEEDKVIATLDTEEALYSYMKENEYFK